MYVYVFVYIYIKYKKSKRSWRRSLFCYGNEIGENIHLCFLGETKLNERNWEGDAGLGWVTTFYIVSYAVYSMELVNNHRTLLNTNAYHWRGSVPTGR